MRPASFIIYNGKMAFEDRYYCYYYSYYYPNLFAILCKVIISFVAMIRLCTWKTSTSCPRFSFNEIFHRNPIFEL